MEPERPTLTKEEVRLLNLAEKQDGSDRFVIQHKVLPASFGDNWCMVLDGLHKKGYLIPGRTVPATSTESTNVCVESIVVL